MWAMEIMLCQRLATGKGSRHALYCICLYCWDVTKANVFKLACDATHTYIYIYIRALLAHCSHCACIFSTPLPSIKVTQISISLYLCALSALPRSSKAEDRGATSKCQQHDFLFGLLFYNLPSTAEATATGQNPQLSNQIAIAQLLLKLGLGNIDNMSYNASFAASRTGQFLDVDWRRNAYDFCELPGVSKADLKE